jgi:hypothetical protein
VRRGCQAKETYAPQKWLASPGREPTFIARSLKKECAVIFLASRTEGSSAVVISPMCQQSGTGIFTLLCQMFRLFTGKSFEMMVPGAGIEPALPLPGKGF